VKKFNRRAILGGSLVAGSLGIGHAFAQAGNAPTAARSGLSAIVTLNSATYAYPNGPKIPSYYVSFHQDGRVVFHLGALRALNWPASTVKPYHLGAHHVRIEDNGKVAFDEDIPGHWWNAEWTYRPRPLAIVKTPAQIVADRRMFSFGNMGSRVSPQPPRVPYKIMGASNITTYMPTTGERPDIGLITDNSAYYMLGGDPGPMLDWAQANDSFPLHYRDETTGKPIDLLQYPQANCYDGPGMGDPWFDRYPRDAQGNNILGGGMVPQQAHFCEMAYVAYLASGDMGFLQNLQYNANFTILCDASKSTKQQAILSGELRGIAWAFRNLFMAHAATQDAEAVGALPSTCHPSSYWKVLLDNQLAYYTATYMKDPNNQYFRLVSGGDHFGPWQVDYMLAALAFGVLTGHGDWTPLYLWALKNVVDRTNGTSGYPPGFGTAYYLNRFPWAKDAQGNLIPGTFDKSAPPMNWAESAQYCMSAAPDGSPLSAAQQAALRSDPLNGGKAMTGNESMMATRAVLVMASYLEKLNLANVRATYPELDTCIDNAERMVRATGGINARQSIVASQ